MNAETINKAVAESLWHLDAEFEERGWDQEAVLYVVTSVPLDESVGVLEMRPMEGWDFALRQAQNPVKALEAMVAIHHVLPAEVTAGIYPPELLYGVALVTEAWMLRGEKLTERDEQILQERHLYQHPDRIEVRFIYCASANGTALTLCHERDGIAEALPGPEGIVGNIPDLLGALIKELKP